MLILLTLALAIVAGALLMIGLGIKMLIRKGGEFKRHCASVDPYTGERSGCVCGKKLADDCKSGPKYHPLEVDRELMNEINGQ